MTCFYRYGVSDRRSILSSDGRTYFPLYGAESASTGGISNSRGKRPAGAFDRRCGALQAGVATDDGGTVLQYHIVQYMKDISGLSLAETLLEQGNQLEDLQGRDLEAEWDAAEESLKEEIFRRKKLQDKDWDGEIPETPSDAVRATRSEDSGSSGAGNAAFQCVSFRGGQTVCAAFKQWNRFVGWKGSCKQPGRSGLCMLIS